MTQICRWCFWTQETFTGFQKERKRNILQKPTEPVLYEQNVFLQDSSVQGSLEKDVCRTSSNVGATRNTHKQIVPSDEVPEWRDSKKTCQIWVGLLSADTICVKSAG